MNGVRLAAFQFLRGSPGLLTRPVTTVISPEIQKYHPHVGNREVVGYGRNGTLQYLDDLHFPYPSIRFRPQTDEIEVLQQKEKGDWRQLSIDEKKNLYRHSFRMTFAEVQAPHPRWKLAIAWATFIMSGAMLYFCFMKCVVLDLPSCSYAQKDYKDALLYRRLYSRDGPIDGLFSRILPVLSFAWRGLATKSEANLISILKIRFPKAEKIVVEDVSGGCGAMFQIFIKSKDFAGMSVLAQHRAVKEALKKEIAGMHGLTLTVEE
ncbi:hypothetical protein AAHC03_012864 [Spirometra sp. Aus1]